MPDANGNLLRYSLEDAAKKINMSKKSLDDYLLQLRFGRKYGFDLNRHKHEKVGKLRAFVRQKKMEAKKSEKGASKGPSKTGKRSSGRKAKNQPSEDEAEEEEDEEDEEFEKEDEKIVSTRLRNRRE